MLHIGRAKHPGTGKRYFLPGQLSVEFVNVGGWLTYGDLAILCSVPGCSSAPVNPIEGPVGWTFSA